MDRKIDAGALLVAAAALLLVVSLFLDWFGLPGDTGITAWEAFEVLDLVLVGAAVAAVAAAVGRRDTRVLLGAALLVLVVVGSQLVQPPPAGQGADREIGAWLALVAAAVLLAGAGLAAAQIAVTVDVRGRERRRRVPTVDKRTPTATPPGASSARADAAAAEPAADRFAPGAGSRAVDPDATQAFGAVEDDDAR